MTLHAAAVEILIEKARFEPQVALGVAEATEATIMHAQLVTVPILDARMQELRADTRISLMAIEHKLDAKIQEVKTEIGQVRGELEATMERVKGELERKMEAMESRLEGRMEGLEGRVDAKMQGIKAELMRWVLLVMLGNVTLSAGVAAILKYIG